MRKAKGLKYRMIALVSVIMILIGLTGEAVFAAEGFEDTASFDEAAAMADTVSYGMFPIYAENLPDGTYEIEVRSSSSFFKIMSAQLTVSEGEMTAVLTMYSSSYSYLYMGSPKEAAAADFSEYIPLEDTGEAYTFTVPVEALNDGIVCSAFSKRRSQWYGRVILFETATLPEGTLGYDLPDYDLIDDAIELYDEANGTNTKENLYGTSDDGSSGSAVREEAEPVEMEIEDGEYSIEVALAGGSGRATVTSPTWLYVKDGKAYAKLLWSSVYYDYMIVGGVTYYNETTDGGNSTFTIPITALDEPMYVIGDTTAMGDPVEIEYTLTFYGDTVAGKGRVPQEAAMTVLIIAVCVMVGGGILNFLVKRRKGKKKSKAG